MKRIICLLLSLVLFVSMSTISTAEDSCSSNSDWEEVEQYIYDVGNQTYSLKIQQKTAGEKGNEYVAQYRFVVNCNGNKVQYETEIYNRKNAPENLLEAIEKDKYLRLDITEMPSIRKKLKNNGINYLCLTCHEDCSVIYVCRHCKGDLTLNTKTKKYVCNDCKKLSASSLRKDVCSKCRGENYTKVKVLWNTTTDWALEDVRQYFNVPEKYIFIENALEINWQNSTDQNIIEAREKLNLDWEQALNLYQNPNLIKEIDSAFKTTIINAVYKNQQFVAQEFTTSETQALYEKYKVMYPDFVFNVLKNFAPDEAEDALDWLYNLLKQYYGLAEDSKKTESSETLKTLFEELQSNYIDDTLSDVEIYEIWSDLSGNIEYAEEIGNEIVDLWFTLEEDFSNYYKEYNYIVNRNNAKKSALKSLCDEIILATTIKNTLP